MIYEKMLIMLDQSKQNYMYPKDKKLIKTTLQLSIFVEGCIMTDSW